MLLHARKRSSWPLGLVFGAALLWPRPAAAAVTASLVGGVLQVNGDAAGDTITLRLQPGDATQLQVLDGGAVVNTFARAAITSIVVNGGAGGDTILIDDANGAFTDTIPTTLDGGDGNDTIIGGAGGEVLSGGPGDDVISGLGGVDTLNGGAGNDALTGGAGNDPHVGGPGDDTMVWNPGDGSDQLDGQDGTDTMLFNGSAADEIMNAVPAGNRITFTRNVGNIVMNLGTIERITVNGLGGNDTITADANLPAGFVFAIDGGDGDDTITGGPGNDMILGGAGVDTLNGGGGNDTLAGGPGADIHFGGPGDDTMIWDPGDGNDTMEGQAGTDTMLFNGSNGAETFVAEPNATRIRFTRSVGNIVMDLATTERITLNALGGNDIISLVEGLPGFEATTVDGGDGNDILNFDTNGAAASQESGSIVVNGQIRALFSLVEAVNLLGTPTAVPTATITSPTADPTITVVTPFITLAGTAADDVAVTAVTWTNDRGGSGGATGTTSWTAANIPLQPGTNVITVFARDANGNRGSDSITVEVAALSYYLSEGATGSFFDLDILLANPNAVQAPVTLTYLKGDGTTVAQSLTLPATSQRLIRVDEIPGLESAEVSASITSTGGLPLIVERTMRWDPSGYGSHTEKATSGPATTWYFAEGSQGFFDTFVLLANPGTTTNQATVRFLLENGAPVERTYDLLPTSRRTIWAGSIPELVNRSFGVVVTFASPGVAERAMYFGPLFSGGHESAGVNAPSTSWFLAEGATGSFFTTFLLLANPGASPADVTLTYLPASGAPVTRTKRLQPDSRLTINIALEDPSLLDAAVATRVTSTQPILVERAQYWPFAPAQWQEAHNSFGATAIGTRWGLAEGRVGLAENYQTFILLANANETTPANVRVTFLRGNGTTVVKNWTVLPSTRFNIHVNSMVPELANETFGAIVEVLNGVGIFVERALYSDANGVVFAAGSNALATPLP